MLFWGGSLSALSECLLNAEPQNVCSRGTPSRPSRGALSLGDARSPKDIRGRGGCEPASAFHTHHVGTSGQGVPQTCHHSAMVLPCPAP